MPIGGRYGPQGLGGPFGHGQPHILHNQHHPPGSTGLPPPSFNTHPGFPHTNPSSALNSFAAMNNATGLAPGFTGGGGLGAGAGTGLASSAAVMGFHGIQQQQPRDGMRRSSGVGKGQNKGRIREVWASNLHQEMQNLRELVEKYKYISMASYTVFSAVSSILQSHFPRATSDHSQDTEFPGVVARPMGQFTSKADYHYQTLRANVDLLSLIQMGITLFTDEGETPPPHAENGPFQNSLTPCPHTWQFNFKFNPETDMFNQESIEFLTQTGMDIHSHEAHGIDLKEFGSLLVTSGLAMADDVRWISFHSGYDFGYLVKLMYCKPLPDVEQEYRRLLQIFFPGIYDIKFMVKAAQKTLTINNGIPVSQTATNILASLGMKSGLQDLADEMGVKRVGTAHQAGSDSLLTGRVFWETKRTIFAGTIDDGYIGQVWGLSGIAITSDTVEGQTTPNLNGASIYGSNSPSTPATAHTGPAQTPNQTHGGTLIPGGGGGVFGKFQAR